MDELMHYGTPRHSGRYPWGSGKDPYQRNVSFLGTIHNLRKQGFNDVDIAKGMNMNTSGLRRRIANATAEKRAYESAEAERLLNKGMSKSAIGRRMGINESTVRSLLDPTLRERNDALLNNSKVLQDIVDKKKYVDVGRGSEQYLPNMSPEKLRNAIAVLQDKGYVVHTVPVEQLGTGETTNLKVLAVPGTSWKEVAQNKGNIPMITEVHTEDQGRTIRPMEPPKEIDSNRVAIRYAEDGGSDRDGVIELRRGVDDISLGDARYAQVRISVDGTHYIKGMAMYSDNLPEGIDILFNTNKNKSTPMLGSSDNSVLKPIKMNDEGKPIDPQNPFGASIKPEEKLIKAQRHYIDQNGVEQLSALNIVNEEGDWDKWSRNLASQMLSKQNPALASQQLKLLRDVAQDEFDEIQSLTNPTVRESLLLKFADQCDSDAVHLQAAALPRQTTKVILPFPSMNEHDIYAPGYVDGEKVALIRYPHGGIFEIPTLIVNNKSSEPKSLLGTDIPDAIGIHPKVAERLSGADFDGDSVIVIPIDNVRIKTAPQLKDLQTFDHRTIYKSYEGMHRMTPHETGVEMGTISNLITDMTIKGAQPNEIIKAVKHSMVVIDAEKHYLNYKQSEIDHGILDLKRKYQDAPGYGASTLLSRSTSEERVPHRKEKPIRYMTPEERERWNEGEKIFQETGKTYTKKTLDRLGDPQYTKRPSQEKSTKMAETTDAYTLVSGTPTNTTKIESVYAEHANSLKSLANKARKFARQEIDVPYSPSAKITYAKEVASLASQHNEALKNAPLERLAQRIAGDSYKMKLNASDVPLDFEHKQRLKGQELTAARARVGAQKKSIWITDREWEAINAGAISKTRLRSILSHSDLDRVRSLATPRSSVGLSTGKIQRAKSMLSLGHTQADVAKILGVSVSTLNKALS